MSTEVLLANGARLVVDNGTAGLLLAYDGGAPNPDGTKRNCHLEPDDMERLLRALIIAARQRWGAQEAARIFIKAAVDAAPHT